MTTAETRCVRPGSGEGVAGDESRAQLDVIAFERAIAEFRAGRPVAIHGRKPILAFAADGFDNFSAGLLAAVHRAYGDVSEPQPNLLLTDLRLTRLGVRKPPMVGRIALGFIEGVDIQGLVADLPEMIGTLPASRQVEEATVTEASAIELAKSALLLPAVISLDISLSDRLPVGTMAIHQSAILSRGADHLSELAIVSRAGCPLSDATDAEIIVFRGRGFREQVAIVIGAPDLSKPVAVRVHSACMTGDLFGSLRCDCGGQLRSAIRHMAENNGGILIYLDQEGRGIGLANKIRAYNLQSRGINTFDADAILGFDADSRSYVVAASMLKILGVSRVSMLTNNLGKASALSAAGIYVHSTVRCHGETSIFNLSYLKAKKSFANHLVSDVDL